MMRRTAWLLTLLTLCAVLPAVAARAQTTKAPHIVEIPDGIGTLLGDYGRAFQQKNRDLLARTLAPALAEKELRAFDNARDVPFKDFRVEPSTQFSGNLAYHRVRAQYPGQEVMTFQVTEKTALDIESLAYEEDGAYTFVRDGPASGDPYDGWRLTSKSDLDVIAFFSPYHLWDAGPVSVLRSDHFVLLTHPEVVDEMRPAIDLAERAYAKATSFWPRQVNERYVVLVPASTKELGDMMHTTLDLGKFVAFVSGGADQENGWVPTGPRVFIHLSHLRNYSPEGTLEILAHELIHAITRPASGPHIPVWVEEGLANFGGGEGGRPSHAGDPPLPTEFPSDDRFATGPVNDIVRMYDQSQVAIQVLDDKFGREALARFYEALGSARVVAGNDDYHVRKAITDTLDWTEEQWIAAWRERLG
ncbi:MAG TPA: hypothetical protein VFA34_08305 [Actinomycetota bacterium]|jgi:hypothetical protein|nr:hypothetical protein [Actinomycetota bacterium]